MKNIPQQRVKRDSQLFQARLDKALLRRFRAHAAAKGIRPGALLAAILDTYLPPLPKEK